MLYAYRCGRGMQRHQFTQLSLAPITLVGAIFVPWEKYQCHRRRHRLARHDCTSLRPTRAISSRGSIGVVECGLSRRRFSKTVTNVTYWLNSVQLNAKFLAIHEQVMGFPFSHGIVTQVCQKIPMGMKMGRVHMTVGMEMATFQLCQNSHRSTQCKFSFFVEDDMAEFPTRNF